MKPNRGEINQSMANTENKRMVTAGEPPHNSVWDSHMIKIWAGDAYLTGRAIYSTITSFQRTAVVHMTANHVPSVDDTDNAVIDRIRVVKYDFSFSDTPNARERQADASLKSDAVGIRNAHALLKMIIDDCSKGTPDAKSANTPVVLPPGLSNQIPAPSVVIEDSRRSFYLCSAQVGSDPI